MTKVAQIKRALDAEAAKLSMLWRGRHVFDGIRAAEENGANWSANFHCVASTCPMDDMREALERVQAKCPHAEFGDA